MDMLDGGEQEKWTTYQQGSAFLRNKSATNQRMRYFSGKCGISIRMEDFHEKQMLFLMSIIFPSVARKQSRRNNFGEGGEYIIRRDNSLYENMVPK